LAPLKRSLSCVTAAQLFVSSISRPGDDTEALVLSQDPLSLVSGRLGSAVSLQLRHQFRYVKEQEHRWHVSTVAYLYRLDNSTGHELVSWHWHPATVAYPHLHVASGVLDKRVHLPTGRVSIESVLRMLLTDLDVAPAHDHAGDYLEVLEASERPFIEHRRWHA
jgi:hypothetical protein